jgi:hypothetical protein
VLCDAGSAVRSCRITSDDATFLTVISNIDRAVRAANPRHTDRSYEFLKKEFVKRLGDLDAKRVRKLIENEEIGDRTPSQFYRHLRNPATSSTSDDFILGVWEGRLPVHIQRVLTSVQDKNPETRTRIANSIHEILSGRIVAVSEHRRTKDSER